MVNIILFGAQGSGKGTQASLIVKKYKLHHISPGEVFRAEVAKGTDLGKELKEYMDKGILVPKEINFKVVENALNKIHKKDFILDGFPRNKLQADFLSSIVPIDFAIEIFISDAQAVKRISARYSCSKCKEGYNTLYIKPNQEGVCDKCGGTLVQRDDDKPEVVKKRLTIYHEDTELLFTMYRQQGTYHKINGEQPIKEVFADIQKVLDNPK